jgi:hypothetical protein
MNLPISPYKFTVYGLKQTSRDPIIDAKGVIVDDGQNLPILLSGSDDERSAKFFLRGVKENVKPHQWKIWLEK